MCAGLHIAAPGTRWESSSKNDGFVEQAVVYSTSTTGLSTLTFEGGVVAGGGGVEERSEVMYCIGERTYIYYREHNGHSCIA